MGCHKFFFSISNPNDRLSARAQSLAQILVFGIWPRKLQVAQRCKLSSWYMSIQNSCCSRCCRRRFPCSSWVIHRAPMTTHFRNLQSLQFLDPFKTNHAPKFTKSMLHHPSAKCTERCICSSTEKLCYSFS